MIWIKVRGKIRGKNATGEAWRQVKDINRAKAEAIAWGYKVVATSEKKPKGLVKIAKGRWTTKRMAEKIKKTMPK